MAKPGEGSRPRPRTPPVRRPRGPKRQPPTTIFITSFRAEGSIRQLAAQIYGGVVEGDPGHAAKRRKWLTITRNYPTLGKLEFTQSPGAWVSNESGILGQVNFPGRVALKDLFALLNSALALDFVEERRGNKYVGRRLAKPMDWRKVYRTGRWKWQVLAVSIVPEYRQKEFRLSLPDGKDRKVIASKSGSF